jgi:hypothetical protein
MRSECASAQHGVEAMSPLFTQQAVRSAASLVIALVCTLSINLFFPVFAQARVITDVSDPALASAFSTGFDNLPPPVLPSARSFTLTLGGVAVSVTAPSSAPSLLDGCPLGCHLTAWGGGGITPRRPIHRSITWGMAIPPPDRR